jgi:hypothetical protein
LASTKAYTLRVRRCQGGLGRRILEAFSKTRNWPDFPLGIELESRSSAISETRLGRFDEERTDGNRTARPRSPCGGGRAIPFPRPAAHDPPDSAYVAACLRVPGLSVRGAGGLSSYPDRPCKRHHALAALVLRPLRFVNCEFFGCHRRFDVFKWRLLSHQAGSIYETILPNMVCH